MAEQFSITDWIDELLPHVPGVSLQGAKQALRATLREFAVDSGAWLHELPPVSLRAGRDVYYLEPTACGNTTVLYIQAISYVVDNGTNFVRFLKPLQGTNYRARSAQAPLSEPWGFLADPAEPGKFLLVPGVSEDVVDALIPYVALGFSEQFEDDAIPLRFRRYWFDHILDGAIGRLIGQQDKPYTNLVLAQYHKRRFRAGVSKARDMARRQMAGAESDFQFPFWA